VSSCDASLCVFCALGLRVGGGGEGIEGRMYGRIEKVDDWRFIGKLSEHLENLA
jgi:hypothetical protein